MEGSRKRTQMPMVTGSSVIGMRCVDGVVMAADTLLSYGSLARFKDVSRFCKLSKDTVIGVGGEYSDFQSLSQILAAQMTHEFCHDDGSTLGPRSIYHMTAKFMFRHRLEVDPYWNYIVLGGMDQGKPFLGMVDLYGTNFESEVIATGFGIYMGLPLLRKAYREDITVLEATKVLTDVMRVLFYRDARSSERIQITTVTAEGVTISPPTKLDTHWEFKRFVQGSRANDDSTW
uniref:Proteasome subunit beta n=1 Tax=Compsopogon caeruleus TaxID=31354 RepID=A0A7S1T8K4_9RHOD|mmetsp:Transcript_11340/g.22957  ORF Transcript_11340/g.22957 Transcript_11340/m.22957 type:complete len:232 (+) Transcript_11340:132-827(+)